MLYGCGNGREGTQVMSQLVVQIRNDVVRRCCSLRSDALVQRQADNGAVVAVFAKASRRRGDAMTCEALQVELPKQRICCAMLAILAKSGFVSKAAEVMVGE